MRLVVGGTAFALVTFATANMIMGGELLLRTDDRMVDQAGRQVYAAQCASCDGAKLEGQPNWMLRDDPGYLPAPPHHQTDHTWHNPEAVLFDLTKHSLASVVSSDDKTRMPAFAGVLSDEQISRYTRSSRHNGPTRCANGTIP
jgi:S-disulfanyl-L-cysteine oxidoreductase SoxD